MIARPGNYLPVFDEVAAREMIRIAELGADAGPKGALCLALSALRQPVMLSE